MPLCENVHASTHKRLHGCIYGILNRNFHALDLSFNMKFINLLLAFLNWVKKYNLSALLNCSHRHIGKQRPQQFKTCWTEYQVQQYFSFLRLNEIHERPEKTFPRNKLLVPSALFSHSFFESWKFNVFISLTLTKMFWIRFFIVCLSD